MTGTLDGRSVCETLKATICHFAIRLFILQNIALSVHYKHMADRFRVGNVMFNEIMLIFSLHKNVNINIKNVSNTSKGTFYI